MKTEEILATAAIIAVALGTTYAVVKIVNLGEKKSNIGGNIWRRDYYKNDCPLGYHWDKELKKCVNTF